MSEGMNTKYLWVLLIVAVVVIFLWIRPASSSSSSSSKNEFDTLKADNIEELNDGKGVQFDSKLVLGGLDPKIHSLSDIGFRVSDKGEFTFDFVDPSDSSKAIKMLEAEPALDGTTNTSKVSVHGDMYLKRKLKTEDAVDMGEDAKRFGNLYAARLYGAKAEEPYKKVAAATHTLAADGSEQVVVVDRTTSGAFTLTLPKLADYKGGKVHLFEKGDGATARIFTVTADGTELIYKPSGASSSTGASSVATASIAGTINMSIELVPVRDSTGAGYWLYKMN